MKGFAFSPLAVALLLTVSAARADDKDITAKARTEYSAGQDHVRGQQWGEALISFEKSLEIKPHALTIFNIGVCERNLGHYTRARASFRQALLRNAHASTAELSGSYDEQSRAYIAEIEAILVHTDLAITPPEAALQVDGRPLSPATSESSERVAGIEPPGPGAEGDSKISRMDVVLDPGPHVFTVARKGFQTVSVTKTWTAGTKEKFDLVADRLPASIRILADSEGAVVRLGGVDVGVVPIDVQRPASRYELEVLKPGFVTYHTTIDAHAGEQFDLKAHLPAQQVSIVKRWWFWTGIAVVAGGIALTTYLVTRPDPTRPAPDGGGLGWTVKVP